MDYIEESADQIFKDPNITALSEQYGDYVAGLKESEKELLAILDLRGVDKLVETINYEQLTKLTFDKAKSLIQKFSVAKRIKVLQDLDKHRVYLYDCTKAYNDQMFGKSMPVKDFMKIMGKIKHIEILQNWLFGIE